ncbi:alpha/beta hydrolase [Microbacterium album]|uniref:Alpha/beta hydrolase fold-3 domain-containing protein n=1 Tax=Microbacterium album TaxID=2053191 RepID=A0A917IDB9_9MICO|nr:alpha/beta hydrolase [Microbacterium album]GGH36894.1 hypothetical protein GCM10010921_06340 [Microbacterium album]
MPSSDPSSGLPADAWALLARHARMFVPEVIGAQRELFAGLLRRSPDGVVPAPHIRRDIAYGAHERHRLDLHSASPFPEPGGGAGRPVVLFVHGGGFVGGDKRDPELPFFDNVGGWAADRGFLGVTMTYRRAPEHRWPAGAEDVAAALGWLRANVAEHGGDPDRIVLFGHSAGAAHVAGLLAGHAGGAPAGARGVAAAILQSGIYDPASADGELAGMVDVYYGDEGQRRERSAAPGLAGTTVPLFVGVAQHDPTAFHRQAGLAIAAILAGRGELPAVHLASGHSHFSPVLGLGTGDAYGVVLEGFIHRTLEQHSGAHEEGHSA